MKKKSKIVYDDWWLENGKKQEGTNEVSINQERENKEYQSCCPKSSICLHIRRMTIHGAPLICLSLQYIMI